MNRLQEKSKRWGGGGRVILGRGTLDLNVGCPWLGRGGGASAFFYGNTFRLFIFLFFFASHTRDKSGQTVHVRNPPGPFLGSVSGENVLHIDAWYWGGG